MTGCTVLALALLAPTGFSQEPEVYYSVPIRDIAAADPPGEDGSEWVHPDRFLAFWAYATLDGDGEAVVNADRAFYLAMDGEPFRSGTLSVRAPRGVEVSGRLYLPDAAWEHMVAHPFTLSPERGTATRESFLRAQVVRYDHLVRRDLPGGAWFRERLGAARAELDMPVRTEPAGREPWVASRPGELEDTFARFSGGRALSENLQLDRLLPIQDSEAETVALDTLEGIGVREFDWTALLAAEAPELDALAAYIPADQHALFFTSFDSLAAHHTELKRSEGLLSALERRGAELATVRDRYQQQLALPWNALVRAFGAKAVRSVAVTGGDLYYPTGTDVAVLFETDDAEALLALLSGLRESAAEAAPGDVIEQSGELAGVAWSGLQSQGRSLSSYAAAHGDVVIVANSRAGLEAVVRTAVGETPRLADSDDFRFFRQRYVSRPERDQALLVIPDAAIRRWCGPHWRIAASRRVRAAAILADTQARVMDGLVVGREVVLVPDPRFPLDDLWQLPTGVGSAEYGTLAFQTPIRELDLERVGKREAELYARWRDGYQRAWSGFFDPIAVELDVTGGELRADVSVLPLIDFTSYRELRDVAGDERLEATDGDPHEEAVAQFVVALDMDSPEMREQGERAASMLEGVTSPFGWVGDFASIALDHDEEFLALLEELGEDSWDEIWEDWSEIPVVLTVDVKSGIQLAAFITAGRAMAEQSMPGLLEWDEDAEGELRFVRVSSPNMTSDDEAVYYGVTPNAWIVSPNRRTLIAALGRAQARQAPPDPEVGEDAEPEEPTAPPFWTGQSTGVVIEAEGLAMLLALLEGSGLGDQLEHQAWSNLPILNEWKRRYPDRDPVALHAEFWGETLRCPGGGVFRWNAELGTMESSVFGSPLEPGVGVDLPPGLAEFRRLEFGTTFEHDGLRARTSLAR